MVCTDGMQPNFSYMTIKYQRFSVNLSSGTPETKVILHVSWLFSLRRQSISCVTKNGLRSHLSPAAPYLHHCCSVTKSSPTLCDTMDHSPARLLCPWDFPGKNTEVGCHFLLQCMKVKSESEVAQSCLTLATPWTAAHQTPPSMGFSRQEYWSGVPLPSPSSHYLTLTNWKDLWDSHKVL